jgi:serine/threonine protein phosphatase PrpC
MYSKRRNLAEATGKNPEFGTERSGRWRADWACIGANVATEDRMVVSRLGDDGVLCAVFDGHYGPRASEFCKNEVTGYIRSILDETGSGESRMKKIFQMLESGWTGIAHGLVTKGDWTASLEGSCAVVAHVTPERLIVGNLGDCRAVLFREEGGELTAVRPSPATASAPRGAHPPPLDRHAPGPRRRSLCGRSWFFLLLSADVSQTAAGPPTRWCQRGSGEGGGGASTPGRPRRPRQERPARGRLLSVRRCGGMQVQLTREHNASNTEERMRIQREHPGATRAARARARARARVGCARNGR